MKASECPASPAIDAETADFAFARLMRTREDVATGYDAVALDGWAMRAREWAKRGDAFVFFISGAKLRAPAAAEALISRLEAAPRARPPRQPDEASRDLKLGKWASIEGLDLERHQFHPSRSRRSALVKSIEGPMYLLSGRILP